MFYFWLCVALCHDVIYNENNKKEPFQGASPDEVCLVENAYKLGFHFIKNTQDSIFIKVKDQLFVYKLLNKIEFTSERKRMTIIVKDPQTNQIVMFTKGADYFILKNLSLENQSEEIQQAKLSLKNFGKQGLRTLCLAMRVLSLQDYQIWNKKLKDHEINAINAAAD